MPSQRPLETFSRLTTSAPPLRAPLLIHWSGSRGVERQLILRLSAFPGGRSSWRRVTIRTREDRVRSRVQSHLTYRCQSRVQGLPSLSFVGPLPRMRLHLAAVLAVSSDLTPGNASPSRFKRSMKASGARSMPTPCISHSTTSSSIRRRRNAWHLLTSWAKAWLDRQAQLCL